MPTPVVTHIAPFSGDSRRPLRAICGARLDGTWNVVARSGEPSCDDCRRLDDEDTTTVQRLQANG